MAANTITLLKKKKVNPKAKPLLIKVSESKGMVKGSIKKISRVLNAVREQKLSDVMNFLYFSPFSAASPVAKIIKSAVANAVDQNKVQDIKDLYIKEIFATQSLVLRRMKAASKGKGSPRKKSYSTVRVQLGIQESI